MMMNKILALSILSFSLSGCITPAYEKSRDLESAKTLQEKRDVLLKWSPFEIKTRGVNDPYNVNEARRRYLEHGEESESFLTGLISSCYSSASDICAYNYYVDANNKNWEEIKKKQAKVAELYTNQLIEERLKKIPVKKGDLFYCKVAINPVDSLVDSGLRAGVKDNVTNFGVIFSNGSQIISPNLKVTDPASGLRTAISESRTETFTAEYDGAGYVVTTYNKYIFTRILGGKYIRNYEYLDDAVRFQMYDCKKA